MEGITFSLNESIDMFRAGGQDRSTRSSRSAAARRTRSGCRCRRTSSAPTVVALENEQGPGLGAAMLAAYGCGWFDSLDACAAKFVKHAASYDPNPEAVEAYRGLFGIYREVYTQTRGLNQALAAYRG